jgi:hypothetical protein
MTAKNPPDHTWQLVPVQVSPPPELIAYTVLEHELDTIAAGPPSTRAINFAVALISIGICFALTLATTTITSILLFIVYANLCIICLLVGIIMLAFWLKGRTSNAMIARIKSRLIVPTPVQEPPLVNPTMGP